MRIVVLYTPAAPDAPPEDLDGLVQRDAVSQALRELGHEPVAVPFDLNLAASRDEIRRIGPGRVFNLVESAGGSDRLIHVAPSLLEAIGIPFAGSGSSAMMLTTNKILAKRFLSDAALPTPEWWTLDRGPCRPAEPGDRVIFKSVWDHGSVGLDDDAIMKITRPDAIFDRLRALSERPGKTWFAERFIEGREFNLSVLSGEHGPEVLPPAEIVFEDYDDGKPRFVGYKAKWETESFEYIHTPRRFDFPKEDDPLLDRLRKIAIACWERFALRGWARVDFRVDREARPFVLEVNVNPCLSPDAGFAAAVDRAGLRYHDAVARILEDVG